MILGMGSDLVDITRIERALLRHGVRFEERVFTEGERAKAHSRARDAKRNGLASTYAKRFAAKEACSKALGTGFFQGVYMRDIEVANLPSGKPTIKLHGGAGHAMAAMVPRGMRAQIDLTMTDEYPMALAVVVISAVAAK